MAPPSSSTPPGIALLSAGSPPPSTPLPCSPVNEPPHLSFHLTPHDVPAACLSPSSALLAGPPPRRLEICQQPPEPGIITLWRHAPPPFLPSKSASPHLPLHCGLRHAGCLSSQAAEHRGNIHLSPLGCIAKHLKHLRRTRQTDSGRSGSGGCVAAGQVRKGCALRAALPVAHTAGLWNS